jgi:hypothetical protein
MWFLCVFLSLVASTSATDIKMTIDAQKVIHPGDDGHIFIKLKNTGEGKEIYLRAFSSGLDISDRERRIRLGTGEETVLVFSYAVNDVKAGYYDLSVVYSYDSTITGFFPDNSTRTYYSPTSHVEHFMQRLERETTIRLIDDTIRLDDTQRIRLSLVSNGEVRFVKYTLNYDANLAQMTYDGSLQNFSGTKEEEIMVVPRSSGPLKAELEIFFLDTFGEFHTEKIPLTIVQESNRFIRYGVPAILVAAALFVAGGIALTGARARHKV